MTTKSRPLGADTEQSGENLCSGTAIAFNRRGQFAREPHDRRFCDPAGRPIGGLARSWGLCWRCQKGLGCQICTSATAVEILCRRCAVWGTREAFLLHGPLERGAPFADYPEPWRREYEPPPTPQSPRALVAELVSHAARDTGD
jgi:hypothetical protein